MPAGRRLLVGTTKGLFLIDAAPHAAGWSVRGPFCDGWPINHAVADPETGTIWAGGGGDWFGAGIWRSTDDGATWDLCKLTSGQMDDWAATDPDFAAMIGWSDTPAPFGKAFSQVWSLSFAHGALHAGTKPAQLLVSRDGGRSFAINEALAGFAGRADWTPGAAGLVLHTIVPDPGDADRMWLAVSAAGVFATEDGGDSWDRRNRMSNAAPHVHHDHPAAPHGGETGHCVHNMALAPASDPGAGSILYQQNHHGVFRSADAGRSWEDVTQGLPSTFGFPIAVHPRDADTIWVLPLNGDMQGRYPPDAAAAVWRSRDGGKSWADCRAGLPQQACFFTVLRQAMTTDRDDPAGVYFGTNSGSVFASHDEGDSWVEIARHLPTILGVETAAHPPD